jgi:hypothetical protein
MPAPELGTLPWLKSARSGAQGQCVEVARLRAGDVAVRNSRDRSGPALVFTHDEMTAFVLGVKDGEFDHLIGPSS